jgi:hypothetical protein
MSPHPRNPHAPTVSMNIESATYDAFRRQHGSRSTQAAITRLVRWFNSLPVDAREAILSDMSPAAKEAVLKLAIRQLRRRGGRA